MRTTTRPWDVGISLIVLFDLAIAQPLLDLVGRNAQFLVAHDASRGQIVLVAIALSLLIPLALAALVLLISAASRAAGGALFLALVAVLSWVLVLRVLKELPAVGSLPGLLLALVAAAAGIAFASAYARRSEVAAFLRFGVPLPVVVVGLFLFASPVNRIVFPPDLAGSASETAREVPVVVIVFDELPTASLMTRDRRIDAKLFPNFARLARDGTWFRNATTVDDATTRAVPAILTGHYPRPKMLPIVGDHPRNLFTLLGPTHRVEAVEPLTGLCPFTYCERDAATATALATDLTVLTLHLVLPEDLTGSLPALEDTWAGFGDANPPAAGVGEVPRARALVGGLDRKAHVRELVSAIRPAPKRSLYFLHLVSPHVPWDHLANGMRYVQPGYLGRGAQWEDDPWVAKRGYQRHLMMLGFTDLMLGRVLDRLEKARIYDDALVVAVADHGVGFEPGVESRNLTEETLGPVAFVPLIVKEPSQRSGRIVDAPVETIDVMPTIADVVGFDQRGMDGRSLAAGELPLDRIRKVPLDGNLRIQPSEEPMFAELRNKYELMADFLDDLFGLAPPGTEHLFERPISEVSVGSPLDAGVEVVDADAYADYEKNDEICRCLIEGTVDASIERGTPLAVALNGRIAGLTQVARRNHFAFIVKPSALRAGRNEIEVYVVAGAGDAAQLQPLRG